MNKNIVICLFIIVAGLCSCKHMPTLPTTLFDEESYTISILQTDTAAHDTAYIYIDDLYSDSIPVNDTLTIAVAKIVKKFDQIELAYKLATKNHCLPVKVRTSRTNDTVFNYI